jgi:glutamate synthase (ferredoxin)
MASGCSSIAKLQPQLFKKSGARSGCPAAQQTAFGYTAEDVDMIIQDMAAQG